uniref:hypothetical protein n=1 Tax=Staphylococcus aureus TaxID=1280 RepID=UPI0038B406DC
HVPSQFAVDEFEPLSNLNSANIHVESSGKPIKQEPSMGFMDYAKGAPIFHQFSSSDLTSVFDE